MSQAKDCHTQPISRSTISNKRYLHFSALYCFILLVLTKSTSHLPLKINVSDPLLPQSMVTGAAGASGATAAPLAAAAAACSADSGPAPRRRRSTAVPPAGGRPWTGGTAACRVWKAPGSPGVPGPPVARTAFSEDTGHATRGTKTARESPPRLRYAAVMSVPLSE